MYLFPWQIALILTLYFINNCFFIWSTDQEYFCDASYIFVGSLLAAIATGGLTIGLAL